VNWDDIIIDAAASDTGLRRSNNQDGHTAVRAPNPEVWRGLDKIGIGKLLVHSAREREFANIYRADDEARSLSDEEFVEVLAFTQAAFAMAMQFRARSEAG